MTEIASLKLPIPTFRTARQMVHGPGSLMALRGLAANRVTLICGRSVASSENTLGRLRTALKGIDHQLLTRESSDEPSESGLQPLLSKINDYRPDVIIAVGGGSVIDTAKLAWLFYEHPGLAQDRLFRPFAIPALRGVARFVAVPTTVGAGSEVSSAAVLFDPQSGRKRAVVTHDFLPDLTILDPAFVEAMPNGLLAATVCDALSHAVEGYVSPIANPMMELFAEQAVREIAQAAPRALAGDRSVMGRLQYAAVMAGWVQNHCLTGAAHALAHQLGELSHGTANALLLPAVIRHNAAQGANDILIRLASSSGLGDNAESLAQLVESLARLGGLPKHLPPLTAERRNAVIDGALQDPSARANPVPLAAEDFAAILEALQ